MAPKCYEHWLLGLGGAALARTVVGLLHLPPSLDLMSSFNDTSIDSLQTGLLIGCFFFTEVPLSLATDYHTVPPQ